MAEVDPCSRPHLVGYGVVVVVVVDFIFLSKLHLLVMFLLIISAQVDTAPVGSAEMASLKASN